MFRPPGNEIGMSWTKFGLLLLVAAMLACGQILFKIAAQSTKEPIALNVQAILQLILTPYFLIGIVIYVVATFFWVSLLRDIEVSKAYLVVAFSIVLVSLAGTFLLHEPFSFRLLVGMAIILAGLAVALW
jgi:drug/metabolite transporter (DMT)-like permease